MQDIYEYLRYTANLISMSRFGNKLILKGGSVLISKLIECDRMDLYRLTSDLDIHCDKKEVWVDFYTNIESILNNNDRNYFYRIIKRRSSEKELGTSDTLTFELNDSGNIVKFRMDMNIKSNTIITVDYSAILNMSTYDATTMLVDKIVVVSSEKIYRRIKDLYDVIVLASIYSFVYSDVTEHLNVKHPNAVLNNMLIPANFEDIAHAYGKYVGIVNKPNIQELVALGYLFLEPFYLDHIEGELTWNTQALQWRSI